MRELLKELMPYLGYSGATGSLIKRIEEELAKPEPDPVGYLKIINNMPYFYIKKPQAGKSIPLYINPPAQQKPLIDSESNLYEALKCLVEQTVDGMGHEYDDGEWPALDKAREALAKAKGDS